MAKEYVDLLVIGNGIKDVYTAYKNANEGKSVVLAVEGESLLSEFSQALCGFFKETDEISKIVNEFEIDAKDNGDGVMHVGAGMATSAPLKLLKKAGVEILFDTVNIGYLTKGEKVCGGIFANKFGVFNVKSKNTYFHKKQKEDYFAFQLGNLDLENNKTPIFFDDVDTIKNITLNRDSKAKDIGIVSFVSDHKNMYEAFEKMIFLVNHLKEKSSIFKNCTILKTALTLERPVFDVPFETTVFDDKYTEPDTAVINGEKYLLETIETNDVLDEYLKVKMQKIRLEQKMGIEKKTNLVITGAGTGGVCAYMAAKKYCTSDVLAIERCPLPGGTRTLGMVTGFWRGYREGFCKENLKNIKEYLENKLNGIDCKDYTGEAMYYVNVLKNDVMYSSVICGVKTDGGKICGIYVAKDGKLIFVKCGFVIDATGDADTAVLAGCKYSPAGDLRDGVPQSYSIWGEEDQNQKWSDSKYKGDDDNISTECYSEYQRGICITNSKNSPYGFSPMLTVRETRKIVGEYTLTLKDIITEKTFDDTIAVAMCLYDAHGVGTSRAYYTNLFTSLTTKGKSDSLRIRISLRCLIPKNAKNIFVISKAISATRDAGCLIRMNADVQNIAYSAGIIASHLLNGKKTDVGQIDIDEEIKCIKTEGILPDWYNKSEIDGLDLYKEICDGNLRALTIASADKSNEKMLALGFENEKDENTKYLFASALAALGSDKPFLYLLNKLNDLSCDDETINENTKDVMSVCTLLSNTVSFNKALAPQFLPVLKKLIETITAGSGYINESDDPYTQSKVHNRTVLNFKTILAIAYAAEELADESLAQPLLKLLNSPYIRLSDGKEVFSVQLYLRLLAACARCGNKESLDKIKEFENDDHLFFRNFAKSELKNIDKCVCPVNEKWDMWI